MNANIRLSPNSIKRSIANIKLSRDTDLFPSLKEFDVLFAQEDKLVEKLSTIDIVNHCWLDYRRFLIPKDDISYRVAMQLDPVDSILFGAIIYEFGEQIEARRIPVSEDRVFSYRFSPNESGQLYNKENAWNNFIQTIETKARTHDYAIYIDIADFYNQVYHHHIENQLASCNLPNQVIKAIKNMLQNTTQTVSHGIPVGNHASHLLAELYLRSFDEAVITDGYDFCRYADDIYVFVNSEIEAKNAILDLARILDSIKLSLQRHKTKIYNREELIVHVANMSSGEPTEGLEKQFDDVFSKYEIDPYERISFFELTQADQEVLSVDKVTELLSSYLRNEPDYQNIKWLYKRLARVGVNSAVAYTIENINSLLPAFHDIAIYFLSIAQTQNSPQIQIGTKLLDFYKNNPLVKHNPYYQLSILHLFASDKSFNHLQELVKLFSQTNDNGKREIILSAFSADSVDWIRSIKHEFGNLGSWSKRALIIAASQLQADERKYFYDSIKNCALSYTMQLLIEFLK